MMNVVEVFPLLDCGLSVDEPLSQIGEYLRDIRQQYEAVLWHMLFSPL